MTLSLVMDRDELLRRAESYKTYDEEEHGSYTTPEHVEADYKAVINIIKGENVDWKEIFGKLDRKKDGTFAKSRVFTLFRLYSQHYHDEEAYGYRAPELRIENRDNETAVVCFFNTVEQYECVKKGFLNDKMHNFSPKYPSW